MKKTVIKKIVSVFALIITLLFSVVIIVLPIVSGQAPNLVMNCGTQAIINFPFDVDLNGPSSQLEGLKFAYKPPGATEFILTTDFEIDNEPGLPGERYVTDPGGDCDIDVLFDQAGDWQVKWVHPATGAESNIVTVTVVLEIRVDAIAFIGVTPNPVGVNQEVLIHTGITFEEARVGEGWNDISVKIERPDGETETLSGITTDPTGGTGVKYIPTMVGTYRLQTQFPEQKRSSGETLSADDSEIIELVVQEDPIPYWPGVSLPENYWVRPINAQFWEWRNIAGNFLEPLNYFESRLVRYNEWAPESAHVLWKKRLIVGGGLAGGATGVHSYECGGAYEDKMRYSVVLGGILYYNQYESRKPDSADQVVAVDLHTGEELWRKPLITPEGEVLRLSFAQAFYWDSYNYHGVFGYLWATRGSNWYAFEPTDGTWDHTLEGVPGGWKTEGPDGEFLIYNYNSRAGELRLWNSSRAVSDAGSWRASGRTIDADRGIEWIKDVQAGLPGGDEDCIALYRMFGGTAGPEEVSSWMLNLEPGHEGELIYNYTWPAPADWAPSYRPRQIRITAASIEDGVFTVDNVDFRQHWGFDINTGRLIWGPTDPENYLSQYGESHPNIALGRLFTGGQGGILYCYNVTTGDLLWEHEFTDPYAELTWTNNYPIRQPANLIVDGKIYAGYGEHSPFDPKPRGAPLKCIDIETGNEIWSIPMVTASYSVTTVIGDSIIAALNTFDNCIYAIGKGPSATTISIKDDIVSLGSSVLVCGTVMDVSPGTDDIEQQLRFPNGVPVMSDESMSEWMKHVFMQFPNPKDIEGVEVVITTFDPNGNTYELGRTISSTSGSFGCEVDLPVPGLYNIIASFEGSESYFGSSADTYVVVSDAPTPVTPIEPEEPEEPITPPEEPEEPEEPEVPTEPEEPEEPEEPTEPEQPAGEAPLISTELVIIMAVAIAAVIGVATYWFLRKRQ